MGNCFLCKGQKENEQPLIGKDKKDSKIQQQENKNDKTNGSKQHMNDNANNEPKVANKDKKIEVKTAAKSVETNMKIDIDTTKEITTKNKDKIKTQTHTQNESDENNNPILLPHELSMNKENKSSYIDETVPKPADGVSNNDHISTPVVTTVVTNSNEQNEITNECTDETVKGSIENENENIQTKKNEIVTHEIVTQTVTQNENVTQQSTIDTQHNEEKTDKGKEIIEQNEQVIEANTTKECEEEAVYDEQQMETVGKNKAEIISDNNVTNDANAKEEENANDTLETDANKQHENDKQSEINEHETTIDENKTDDNNQDKDSGATEEQHEYGVKITEGNTSNNEEDVVQESEIIHGDITQDNLEEQKEDTPEKPVKHSHSIENDIKKQQEIEWKRQSKLIAKQISKQLNSKISDAFLDYVSNEFESLEELKDDLDDVNEVSDSSIIDGIKERLKNNNSVLDIEDKKLFIIIQEIVGKVNYNQLKSDILPAPILHIISDFLNVIHLFVTENIVIKLHYNNGHDSFGNYWEESISFNHKTDEKLNECDDELRIGVVSHYNLNRMAVDNEWTEQQKLFIFELSNELIPKSLNEYLNCNVHERTKKYIEGIRHNKSSDYIECIKIVCKERKGDENRKGMKDVDDAFRREIFIPCDKMFEIFCEDNKENDMEFTIHESYDESEPHLHENARLTVINGEDNDPLGVND